MKIRGISTHFVYTGPHRNWTLVKIDTDEGIHGWGEATVEGKEKTVAEAIHELERQLIGRDPFEIEKLWQEMYRDAFWVGGPILTSAMKRFPYQSTTMTGMMTPARNFQWDK